MGETHDLINPYTAFALVIYVMLFDIEQPCDNCIRETNDPSMYVAYRNHLYT